MWTVKIDVTNLSAKRFSVTGTRTVGEDVQTYTIHTRWDPKKTKTQNAAAIRDGLRAKRDAEIAVESSHATLIGTLETTVATGLDAQEI